MSSEKSCSICTDSLKQSLLGCYVIPRLLKKLYSEEFQQLTPSNYPLSKTVLSTFSLFGNVSQLFYKTTFCAITMFLSRIPIVISCDHHILDLEFVSHHFNHSLTSTCIDLYLPTRVTRSRDPTLVRNFPSFGLSLCS
ncbi:hypothetical protein GEMRC1_006001 [Eukaryota sp. GEM-RC1]